MAKKVYVDANQCYACFSVDETDKNPSYIIRSLKNNPLNVQVAEFTAILFALHFHGGDVDIYCDNQNVVKIINRGKCVDNPECDKLLVAYGNICQGRKVTVNWVKRAFNKAGIRLDKHKLQLQVNYYDKLDSPNGEEVFDAPWIMD
jgi:ribonuclease HI